MNPTDNHTEIFWNWFVANSERLTMLNDLDEPARQQLLDEMQHQLSAYHDGLTFEIGDQTAQGRTLTISAEGDFDLFRSRQGSESPFRRLYFQSPAYVYDVLEEEIKVFEINNTCMHS